MFRVPPSMINALNSVTKRRVRMEWSNDRFATVGGELDVYDSQFTCDSTSQVRWTATCSAINVDDRINPLTTWMRAFLEIKGVRAQWWTIPMGVYRVSGMKISEQYYDFVLDGLEIIIQDYRFHVPRSLPLQVVDSPESTLVKLILECIPTARIHWLVKTSQTPMQPVTFDRDRWAVIDGDSTSKSITKSLSADCFVDRVGNFVVAPIPIETRNHVWQITMGHGVKVSKNITLSRENMKNVWTVWAAPSNGPVIGPVHVWDADPGSPTYAGSNPIKFGAAEATSFGIVPGFYQSPLMRSLDQCALAGKTRLSLSLAFRRHMEITSIFNPTLDAGDCVAVIPGDTDHLERFIIEKVAYRMDDAYTSMSLREKGPAAMAESDTEDLEGAIAAA